MDLLQKQKFQGPVYNLSSFTILVQTPLSILVQPFWPITVEYWVNVNKVAAVYQYLHNEDPISAQKVIETSTAKEEMRATMKVYITRFLIPGLFTGKHTLCVSWSILQDCANKLRISKACAPLWAWLWVKLLTDYMGKLNLQITHFMVPLQSAKIIDLGI